MKEFDDLINIIRVLRAPGGCPWDRAQKLTDYKRFLLEEAYELIEGIDAKKKHLIKEELGDLFLILALIAEMVEPKNKEGLAEVLEGINQKLVSRHPHVFSKKKLKTKEEVLNYWIASKAKKKKRKTIEERLPLPAPSLFLAHIFWREYFNIDKISANKGKAAATAVEKINFGVSSLGKSKARELLFADILFELSRLAEIYRVDLEPGFRKKIIEIAGKTKY
jgi:tetrapyrrole methylase family protein/MazG family protein